MANAIVPPAGLPGVSASDQLTVQRQIAQAINQAAQNYLNVHGVSNSGSLAAATLIKTGAGRVCRVIVTTAGAAGTIYDSANSAATTNPVFVVPATLGIYDVNLPVRYGIVYVPGAAQVAVVSFS